MSLSALPQRPSRWNVREPVCFDCAYVQIDAETCLYALARCALMPDLRPFGLHWRACRKFRRRQDGVGIAPAPERRMNRG